MTDFAIQGGAELAEALSQFPLRIERNALRGALRAGAVVFLKQLRANAASAQVTVEARQRLARSFYVKTGRTSDTQFAGVGMHKMPRGRVSRSGKPDSADDPKVWELWLEKGTKDRFRRTVSGRRLNRRQRVGTGRSGRMMAHPVARPALDVAGAAVDAVADYLRERIEKELTR